MYNLYFYIMKQMFIWSSEVVFDEQTKSEMQESKRELLGDDSYVLSEEEANK